MAGFLVAFAGACASGMSPPGSLKSGVVHYGAASAIGAPLLSGTMRIVTHDDSSVTGTWVIDWVVGADTTTPVGPQVGAGTLSGRQLSDGTVALNLNPLYADNNVFLNATVQDSGFAGAWSWSGMAGPIASGRFTALF